ncbi:unnamed protein product [Brachionus calyciflorus]|uniref:AD domain-containing protein n=1 Tax=Brachionus calyciflorus TaxID=104777 RepID=A0A813QBG3_9BILA|nr:unnamed protein product [Brachionus calyciflorus]
MTEAIDPSYLYQHLKKYVEIQLKSRKKETKVGWVYTIDPVSLSYVLVEFMSDEPKNVTVIMGEEVAQVKILPVTDIDENTYSSIQNKLHSLFSESVGLDQNLKAELINEEFLIKRRNELIKWLNKNRLPVKLDTYENNENLSVINILDTVFIKPPYEEQTCESTNEIILDRVQNLIKNLN